jgi:hypothetical protein
LIQAHVRIDRLNPSESDPYILPEAAVALAWRRRPYKVELSVMFGKILMSIADYHRIFRESILINARNARVILHSRNLVTRPQTSITTKASIKVENLHAARSFG